MSEAPVPNNFIDLIPSILFGIFSFAFGFEAVVALNAGQPLLCAGDVVACLVLAMAAVIWVRHKEWLPQKVVSTTMLFVTDARWLFVAFTILLLASAASPYISQQPQWPNANFDLSHNWPLLAVLVAGGILLLIVGLATGYALARTWAVPSDIRTPSLKVPAGPSNIYHARTISNFSSFETESVFNLILRFFNGSNDELIVNSVSGKVYYTELGEDVSPPILWLNPNVKTAPFDTIDINLEQRVPPGTRQRMQDTFAAGRSISINIEGIVITVRASSGEEIQLRHWQGVVCKIEKDPVIIGQLLIVYGNGPISTGASSVR